MKFKLPRREGYATRREDAEIIDREYRHAIKDLKMNIWLNAIMENNTSSSITSTEAMEIADKIVAGFNARFLEIENER